MEVPGQVVLDMLGGKQRRVDLIVVTRIMHVAAALVARSKLHLIRRAREQ